MALSDSDTNFIVQWLAKKTEEAGSWTWIVDHFDPAKAKSETILEVKAFLQAKSDANVALLPLLNPNINQVDIDRVNTEQAALQTTIQKFEAALEVVNPGEEEVIP